MTERYDLVLIKKADYSCSTLSAIHIPKRFKEKPKHRALFGFAVTMRAFLKPENLLIYDRSCTLGTFAGRPAGRHFTHAKRRRCIPGALSPLEGKKKKKKKVGGGEFSRQSSGTILKSGAINSGVKFYSARTNALNHP